MNQRITLKEFVSSGGLSNRNLYRVMRGKQWIYWRIK